MLIINNDVLLTDAVQYGTVDLIVTSPPYNIQTDYASSSDAMPYSKYLQFTKHYLERCFNWLKDDGRMCLNIPLDISKGGQLPVGSDITQIALTCGLKYHSTIIWNEQNISRRTAWGSFKSASAPYVIAPVELIVVLYKKDWKKYNKGISDISKDQFILWTNGVWSFPGESKKRVNHPAPFPVELPTRCIKLFSYVGDVVLDPFCGSGTTLIACDMYDREGIGIEIDKGYCDIAIQRLEWRRDNLKLPTYKPRKVKIIS